MVVLTTLYFDCASGAAGDMILGALIDAGVALDAVRTALGSLAIDPDTVWTQRVTRAGISATKFCVRGEDEASAKHHHPHPHPPAATGSSGRDTGTAVDAMRSGGNASSS